MNNFKENLKDFVKSEDITMAQLARETGIAPQTLNNWVAGQEPRSLDQIKKVADYFKVSLDELCFGVKASSSANSIDSYSEDINAGVFEVILRKVKI